ncbi:MAG: magnesium transporter [Tissierellia bacterium]|nr:magnesium transporter [Tissierellia bacterium]
MDLKQQEKYFRHLIDTKDLKNLQEEVSKMNEADLAEILEDFDERETLLIFRMLPKDLSIAVFTYMTPSQQRRLVSSITDEELQSILKDLYFDDRIDVLEEMPAGVVTKIIANAPAEERKLINEFLQYPEDSAGSIMTIEYVSLKPEMTVKEALDYIKENGMNKETIYTCYVQDKYKKLLGFVSLRELVTSDEDAIIEDIMLDDVIYVETLDDQEQVADQFIKYGYLALPVVDKEHRLCGIITVDDIMEVLEIETTEDFHRMAAIEPSEGEYMEETPWQLAKNRIPWLLILMLSATLTGGIINRYNWIISDFIILTTFIPMITDTGGNTGSQSSTVVIRGLATGEIELEDLLPVMWKETKVGVIAGAVLSLVNFLRLFFIVKTSLPIAILVSLTILVTVILSKLMGAFLPIVVKKLGADPALMASSLITTVIDSLVLVIYFNMAKLFLYTFG